MSRNFMKLLQAKWDQGKFVCVGLDSDYKKIPKSAYQKGHAIDGIVTNTIVAFNRAIVEATKDIVCAYKPNIAFYEAYGVAGLIALHRTIVDINALAPDVPVILDAKRGDIGNTNDGYVNAAFNFLQADAITLSPYLGRESLQAFLDLKDKGIIVLCRTSNEGAGEFQDLTVSVSREEVDYLVSVEASPYNMQATGGCYTSMSNHVAYQVSKHWNKNGNCILVVGATYPAELESIRRIAGDMPILIPGIGAQGGDLERTVMAGMDSHGQGMIINSSRGIIFASDGPDYAEAARRETLKLHDPINQYRQGY